MSAFKISDKLSFEVSRIGRRGEPLMLVDDVLEDPATLLRTACHHADWARAAPGGYPGMRAPLPGDYVRALLRRLDAPIKRVLFPDSAVRLERFDCSFSMVTLPPSEKPIKSPQRNVPFYKEGNWNYVVKERKRPKKKERPPHQMIMMIPIAMMMTTTMTKMKWK